MNAPVALTPELLTQLTAIVGENRIKTDADSLENWGRDHTKHFDPNPSVIVFPSSTEQVQARLPHRAAVQAYLPAQSQPMAKSW